MTDKQNTVGISGGLQQAKIQMQGGDHSDVMIEDVKENELVYVDESRSKESEIRREELLKNSKANEGLGFKADYFFKFFLLNLIRIIFGPFTYFFICRRPQWRTFARNVHLFGGSGEILRIILWILRMYAIASAIVINKTKPDTSTVYDNLYVNLYVLIFTEISLGVLYAAYYSSFRKSQIDRFMTDPTSEETTTSLSSKLSLLKKQSQEQLLTQEEMALDFPDIDSAMFTFAMPESSKYLISTDLKIMEENHNSEFFENVQDVVLVDGISVCSEILKKSEFKQSFTALRKSLAMLIVFLRVIYPILEVIYVLLTNSSSSNFGILDIAAGISYFSFAVLLFRFYEIYDTLFLGLVLYCEKLRIMNEVSTLISERQSRDSRPVLKVSLFIPQNSVSWLSARRILSNANMQICTVVDINLSYTLIYLAIYVVFVLLSQYGGTQEPFFMKFPAYQIMTATYLIVMIIIVIAGLAIGLLINDYFHFHRRILFEKLDILKNLKFYTRTYLDNLSNIEDKLIQNPLDRYLRELNELRTVLRNDRFYERFNNLVAQNIQVLSHVKDQLQWDEQEHPHTLLGLKTDLQTLIPIASGLSAVGISNIRMIINSFNSDSSQ